MKGNPPENQAENFGKSKNAIIFENFHTPASIPDTFSAPGETLICVLRFVGRNLPAGFGQ